jgi:hypothetical protein
MNTEKVALLVVNGWSQTIQSNAEARLWAAAAVLDVPESNPSEDKKEAVLAISAEDIVGLYCTK